MANTIDAFPVYDPSLPPLGVHAEVYSRIYAEVGVVQGCEPRAQPTC